MAKGHIILLEGTSNTGKTTLCNYFVLQKGYVRVGESIRYLEARTGLDQSQIMSIPENINQEELNQELLFDMEFQKLFDANLFANQGRNVVIDKSIFGIMATAYAFEIEKKITGGFNKSLQLLDTFMEKAKRFGLSTPEIIILLSVSSSKFDERNEKRTHVLSSEWTRHSIIELQNVLLRTVIPLSHIPFVEIDTTEMTQNQVAQEVEKNILSRQKIHC